MTQKKELYVKLQGAIEGIGILAPEEETTEETAAEPEPESPAAGRCSGWLMNEQDLKNRVLQQLKGLSDTVVDTVGDMSKGKNVFCPSNIVNDRISTCNACPEFVRTTTQCKQCGCFMSAKQD